MEVTYPAPIGYLKVQILCRMSTDKGHIVVDLASTSLGRITIRRSPTLSRGILQLRLRGAHPGQAGATTPKKALMQRHTANSHASPT